MKSLIFREDIEKLHYWLKKAKFNLLEGNHKACMNYLNTIEQIIDEISFQLSRYKHGNTESKSAGEVGQTI